MLSKRNGISYSSAVFVLKRSKSERGLCILLRKRSSQQEQNKELKVGENQEKPDPAYRNKTTNTKQLLFAYFLKQISYKNIDII